jgi:hypothetical protein
MKDLSALTPPLLVCIVVLIAVVAFLRHEMGKPRSSEDDEQVNSAEPSDASNDLENNGADVRPSSEPGDK